jgi:hypothetical protein
MEKIKATKDQPDLLKSLLWVAKARSKDPQRRIISGLHIEADPTYRDTVLAVATDGRRLHVAKLNVFLPPGNYEIIRETPVNFLAITAEDEGTYPRFQGVIPKCDPKDFKEIAVGIPRDQVEKGGYQFQIATAFHALNQGSFNLIYLLAAVSDMYNFAVHQKDALEAVLIQDQRDNWTRLAVVMPLRTS